MCVCSRLCFFSAAHARCFGAHRVQGNDVVDFAHGWLNYQIEHHCFPTLSMLSYQRMMPRVKAICRLHGIPYIQQPVTWRLRKLLDVAVGKTSMRRWPIVLKGKSERCGLTSSQ